MNILLSYFSLQALYGACLRLGVGHLLLCLLYMIIL
jgi:hypothetical protein